MSTPTSTTAATSSANDSTTNNTTNTNTTTNPSAPAEGQQTAQQPVAPAAPPKRPRRRAPTAERRATHNAVERARRETLNGRFLALASMLPPLRVIRRPSKSAIVNSSIATVHAARRHRVLAAQTLKGVMREAEALRKEVNEWRARARIPTLDAPLRSEADAAALDSILRGEVEELDVDMDVLGEFDDEGDEGEGMGPIGEEGEEEMINNNNTMLGAIDEDVKPRAMQIKTDNARFAYDAPQSASASALSLSPLSMSPLSAGVGPGMGGRPSMPSPPATGMGIPVSMPSPGGSSEGSWEGPRTPPTPAHAHMPPAPVGMYRNKPSTYPGAQQYQQHNQHAGAAYDLGLGLFDVPQQHPPQQTQTQYAYQDAYVQGYASSAGAGVYPGIDNGWATPSRQNPAAAYHHQMEQLEQQQMYAHHAHGAYMHQPSAMGTF
ncbi:BHLH domain-containing protein [Mycena chlorophos]|uniref:BHLH domain-containing protein n=1 Tax=Mycena chlorophos TaxID=658473 RepID=A0A8H6SSD2_MYCCL|nr:BHLH domain-containing protein [Mycena chlorophos]